MWQCFLTNADSAKTEPKSVSHLDNLGMDSAKLQCCFRAATLTCQRLCIKVKTNNITDAYYLVHLCLDIRMSLYKKSVEIKKKRKKRSCFV